MDFDFTPEEAQPLARILHTRLASLPGRLAVEKAAWPDAPYRTTIVHEAAGMITLYEVQGSLDFHDRLKAFSDWTFARRFFSEIYVVATDDGQTSVGNFRELSERGVGLMVHNGSTFSTTLLARNPALQVTPEPTLKYGPRAAEVRACVKKFNDGNRKDGLRDLCEIVEGETEDLIVRASTKGWCTIPVAAVQQQDWAGHINSLASVNAMAAGKTPIIDSKMKDDLHSFRGSRNLFDHKVTSRLAELRRQRQFAERMMMGPRLVSELIALKRKVK